MPPRSKRPRTTGSSQNLPYPVGNYVQIRPLHPDDPELQDEENDLSFSVQPEVIFPCFETITHSLVRDLHEEIWKEFTIQSYWGHIEMLGGVDQVVRTALRCIYPSIRALEGKRITPQMLNNIRDNSSRDPIYWPAHSGYLSYVCDERNDQYWRAYVGQSSKPAQRIKQHIEGYYTKDQSSLHYYILSKSRSWRSVSFINLWSLPSIKDPGDENQANQRLLLSNILEMVMCRAFQTLSSPALKKFFGDQTDYANVGLNVLPPLLQGLEVSIPKRRSYMKAYEQSIDPQIQQWPKVRQAQRESFARSSNNLGRPVAYRNSPDFYQVALKEAISIHALSCEQDFAKVDLVSEHTLQPEKIIDLIEEVQSTIESSLSSASLNLIKPCGRLKAKIGIILDWCPVNRVESEYSVARGITAIPPILRDCGFDQNNSLVWSHNLRHTFISTSISPVAQSTFEDQVIRAFHRSLVQASNLRVIIICGPNAERSIISPELEKYQITINLRGYSYSAYAETDERKLKRLYVRLPIPLTSLRSTDWRQCTQFGELIRFTSTILDIEGIKGYAMANKSLYRHIVTQYADERDKRCDVMTCETLDPILLDWMSLKGLTSQDILKFEKLGGSMIRGIFLLLVALPRKPKGTYQLPRALSRGHENRIPLFSQEQLKKARELYKATSMSLNTEDSNISSFEGGLDGALVRSETLNEVLQEPELLDEALEQDIFEDLETHNLESLLQNQATPAFSDNQEDLDIEEEDGANDLYEPLNLHHRLRAGLLAGRHYKGRRNRERNSFQISTWQLNLMIIDQDIDLSCGFIVSIDISPLGVRNPNIYVKEALDSDPASRVAFNVIATTNSGESIMIHPQTIKKNNKTFMRVNVLFDLLQGLSLSEIIATPRRFVSLLRTQKALSDPRLSRFIYPGDFTDGI